MTEKVLLVDDDTNILTAYSRCLRKQFELWTTTDGRRGLEILESEGPFATVVSDMHMPVMDGIVFLGEVRSRAPDTVRMILTGDTDIRTAVDAVNEGNIFRFCTKPCPPETLEKVIEAGLKQYRLIMAEQTLLQQTLAGSVKVLVDVLSLTTPEAFNKTKRLRGLAQEVAKQLGVSNPWELDLAAMLSPIGQITLPAKVTDKIRAGAVLTEVEWDMVDRTPEIGSKLIANIPRLQGVSDIVYFQDKGFDGSGFPGDWVAGKDIPIGARILKVLIDLLDASDGNPPNQSAFGELEKKRNLYDPVVLSAVRSCLDGRWGQLENVPAQPVIELSIQQLRSGDRLVSDLISEAGYLVLAAGHELSQVQAEKVRNLHKINRLKEPARVIRPAPETAQSGRQDASAGVRNPS